MAESFISKITAGVNSPDLSEIKSRYENNIEKQFGKKTLYNKAAVSILDLIGDNKLQCYSGTVLNQIVMRTLYTAGEFRDRHLVIIFESGHVLPGYFELEAKGFHLYGIETTVKGRGMVDYGMASELKAPIRIVDAEYFALVETLKTNLKDPAKTVDSIVKMTAEKYGIAVSAIDISLTRGKNPVLNSSPFGFGESTVADGDQERIERESVVKKGGGIPVLLPSKSSVSKVSSGLRFSMSNESQMPYGRFDYEVTELKAESKTGFGKTYKGTIDVQMGENVEIFLPPGAYKIFVFLEGTEFPAYSSEKCVVNKVEDIKLKIDFNRR
jgi:hypothetical protein